MNKTTVIMFTLLAAFARESAAQSTPTASELEQERQRIELERKQMFDAGNPSPKVMRGAIPNSTDIEREMRQVERERKPMFDPNNPATKNAANVFPSVPTPESAGIDIEAMAKRYEQKAAARKMDDLMIFASFTMPAESLKRIVSQANRAGASVVLRGFKNNSIKDTALAINALGEQGGNVLVNPNAFTKYKVKAVPTMVLAKAATIDHVDNEGCALPDDYVAVSGDVSLDYALDDIVRRSPQFASVASRYLRQIRGNQ